MLQFIKWLLFGCSSSIEIDQMSIPPQFNETIIIITLNKIFIFSLNSTLDFFNEITSKLNNVELFITSLKDEASSDKLQILKIAKFIQWTNQVKRIGIPLDFEQSQNIIKLEKWPIIASTGLDSLKLGFFTMNHQIVDIRKDLENLYHQIDLNTCANLINAKTNLLEITILDMYNTFEREPINKRLEKSEENMNDSQYLELLRLDYANLKKTTYDYLSDLPDPRDLYGTHSNINFDEGCSTEALYKTTFDFKVPAFHMTYENMDPVTGIRIGRTFFLYNLQETYLDLNNETFKYDYVPALIYKEAFYLFNLYYILVSFSRSHQFDIILGSLDKEKAKVMLAKELNDYIMSNYSQNYFDYLINEDKILIDIREYFILSKATPQKGNKTIVLRFELKEILSAVSHRRVGSLLFADSFLYCYRELFNLTSDILSFKFIMTSTRHYKIEDYNHHQILNSVSSIKIKNIEYRALVFYKDEYNLPYIFPDSHELGLDHNQMFLFYTGKLNVYDDYIVFNDSAVGSVIVSFENIQNYYFIEELKYTVMLFQFEDTKCLPLSGIAKNELIVYFRGNSENSRAYARSVIDFLKENKKMKGKVSMMTKEKLYEYEIVIKTMNENEYEHLNHISNSYNLTNINDVLNEMLEYEYLKFTNNNKDGKFFSFSEYKSIKIDAFEEITAQSENPIKNKKKKIMFLFGTDPKDVTNMSEKVKDLAKKSGIKTTFIIPPLSLFNFVNKKDIEECDSTIINYLTDSMNNCDNNSIIVICIYHSCNVIKVLHSIVTSYDKFYEEHDILNISYCVNYSNFKCDKHKDLINKDFYYEDIINFIFVDEGLLKQEKIDKFNKIVKLSNPYSKLYNHRSFYLNEKEMKKNLFEKSSIGEKMLNFYFTYYLNLQCNTVIYQNCFIPFKYMCKEELLKKFLKISINYPIKSLYSSETFPEASSILDEFEKSNPKEEEQFKYFLIGLSNIDKLKAHEPVFTHIIGNCMYIIDNNKPSKDIISFYANYKGSEASLSKLLTYPNNKSEIGIYVLGKNILGPGVYDVYNKMIMTLSGELPKLRAYRNRSEITKEERSNLNFANLTRPLPPGWEQVDTVVIDPDDVIHYEHPDIEKFIDEYIELDNMAIDQHNKEIQSEIDSLLI